MVVVLRHAGRKKAEATATPVSIGVAPAVDETAAHVAAVYTVVGAHRLVHISEAAPGAAWTATGRLAHHTSHMPRHTAR